MWKQLATAKTGTDDRGESESPKYAPLRHRVNVPRAVGMDPAACQADSLGVSLEDGQKASGKGWSSLEDRQETVEEKGEDTTEGEGAEGAAALGGQNKAFPHRNTSSGVFLQ